MEKIIIKTLSFLLLQLTKKDIRNATLMDGSGRFIRPFRPECKEVDLNVIGTALSRIMRFFGQTELSVAQHCVNMAKIFFFQGEIEFAKQALLHEIAEAFMGDLASPLKKAFPIYKEIEEYLIKKVYLCYGLSYPMAKEVHVLDKSIMINEALKFMPNSQYWLSFGSGVDKRLLELAGVVLSPWDAETAKQEFMNMAKILELI